MKLLVRNLSRTTTEESLKTLFSEYGSVASCDLVLDQESGKSKGFAFVDMPTLGEAIEARSALHESMLDGKKIRVKKAAE